MLNLRCRGGFSPSYREWGLLSSWCSGFSEALAALVEERGSLGQMALAAVAPRV